jgi:hypothetical protein
MDSASRSKGILMNRFGSNQINLMLQKYGKQYLKLSEQIKSIPLPSLIDSSIIDSIAKIPVPNERLIQLISKQVNGLTAVLDKVSIPSLISSTGRLIDAQNNYKEREKQYVYVLAKCGWPPLWDIPIHYIRKINKTYEEMDFDDFSIYINKWILDFYTAEVFDSMIERWTTVEIIKKRLHILKDVIKAHLNKDYTLSIPTLLPQIEGTLRDYDYNGKQISKKTLSGFIDLLLQDKDEYIPVKGLIVDELYEHFKWGDEKSPALSRHAILHGSDVSYNTEINSLRVILIYDMIVELITMMDYKKEIHLTTAST